MFNITNYFEHPTRPGYYVFKFYDKNRSDYFEELLNKEGIWYETSKDDGEKITFLYDIKIKINDYKKALNANYLVSAKFRKKTISNQYVRIFIYTITLVIIALAIYGALKSKS